MAEEFNRAITLSKDIGVNSAILLPIAKPNKTFKLQNIRLICIVPILKKILSNITLNKIRKAAEEFIGRTQPVLIKERSTADIIWTYRFNMATVYKIMKNLTITDIGISSAFNTINRPILLNICRKFALTDHITLIKCLLSDTSLTIKMNNHNTTLFNTTISVFQSDSSSQILFCLFLREAISKLHTNIRNRKCTKPNIINEHHAHFKPQNQ